jgi:hypothetical protein
LKRFTLYSIEITGEIYSGHIAQMGGIGVLRRLRWHGITAMPNFWKPGFMMTMELDLSDGCPKSLISAYNFNTRVTPQRRPSNGL